MELSTLKIKATVGSLENWDQVTMSEFLALVSSRLRLERIVVLIPSHADGMLTYG
jgi:hypothetical protein